jgi:hypothetical protein
MNSEKITNFELGTDETNDLLAKSHGVHDGGWWADKDNTTEQLPTVFNAKLCTAQWMV